MQRGFTFLVLVALMLGAAPVLAQEEEEDLPINFVFATQLGSGIYSVGDQTIQVYRIPISVTLRKLGDDRKWGLKARFPLTFGFADFKLQDIVESGLPDSVETVSLVPGLQFLVPIDRHWTLKPYVEGGVGTHFSGGQLTWVYSGGIKVEGDFPTRSFKYLTTGEALYAGQYASQTKEQDDFVLLRAGFAARHPLWFSMGAGEKATGGLYVRAMSYIGHLRFRQPGQDPVELSHQWEVGVTLGRERPWRWWWIKIKDPRFGLGYRWGKDFWAVRLVLGSPI
jgi:hypothetical protein